MRSVGLFVCLSVWMSVCLSVDTVSRKLLDGPSWNVLRELDIGQRTAVHFSEDDRSVWVFVCLSVDICLCTWFHRTGNGSSWHEIYFCLVTTPQCFWDYPFSDLGPDYIVYIYSAFQSGHQMSWCTTPMYGGRSAVSLLLHLATLLSGLIWTATSSLLSFAQVSCGCASAFYKNQKLFVVSIHEKFASLMIATRQKFKGKPLTGIIDSRYDSPGNYTPVHKKRRLYWNHPVCLAVRPSVCADCFFISTKTGGFLFSLIIFYYCYYFYRTLRNKQHDGVHGVRHR